MGEGPSGPTQISRVEGKDEDGEEGSKEVI